MTHPKATELTRRERQIMDIVYRLGEATASEVREGLPDPPSYSAVRAMLRKLEQKGHLRHRSDGPRYVFQPTVPRGRARRHAMSRLVRTFFDGSVSQAIHGLLGASEGELSQEELDFLAERIEQARKGGR